MPPKGHLPKRNDSFTGFLITYSNGSKIFEKENYFSKRLNKKCATNWGEVDKSQISSIELLWRGESKARIDKAPSDLHDKELTAKDWFFSQRAYFDMVNRKTILISRNIGYIEDNIIHIISVVEDSGEVIRSIRAAS